MHAVMLCVFCPTNCLHFPSCCVQQKLDGVSFFTKARAKIYFQTVDEKPQFTDEELQEYVRQYHAQPGVVPVRISMQCVTVRHVVCHCTACSVSLWYV